jgi:RNA polymerase sigma-70 factor, ECF subfamily
VALGERFPDVLEAARAGAEWAWTVIYRDLSPPVLGYIRARGAPDAEDLLGEVFVQLVRGLPTFEGEERAFRAWVFTIADHRLIDDRRLRTRRPVEPVVPEVLEARGPTGDAEEEGLEAVARGDVRELIGELTPDQERVLLLRILGDLSIDEIARVLGKRPGAVKALQRRGLAAIQEKVGRAPVTL